MFILSPFHAKARKWVKGREGLLKRIQASIPPGEKLVWMHCASLGEFEQGRPLIEKFRMRFPAYKILLTFFSPSGYEVQKDYQGADWVFYLPMDGSRTARRFLEIVKPSLAIFVKYEFWYYYLKKIKYRKIPLILVSAVFRRDMNFFKWYGGLSRKMLSRFDHLFVQNQESADLLTEIGLAEKCTVAGDSRFDRVVQIASQKLSLPLIENFVGNSNVIVAGSTWPEDEIVLSKTFNSFSKPYLKFNIAPTWINSKHLCILKRFFPGALFYSALLSGSQQKSRVLIIDSMGLLSKIYRYADISYVGGGLRSLGVHNVLEAAVYYKPVLFGPYYEKYREAAGLVKSGGGLAFTNELMLKELIEGLLQNKEDYDERSKAAGEFVLSQQGSTEKILQYVQEKQLLKN